MSNLTHTIDHGPAGTTAPALADGSWRIDRRRSEIGFAVKEMWGLRTVRGVFGTYDGNLEVRAGEAAGRLTIETGSLDTGHKRRDEHLRSSTFFDAEHHPRIVFAATAVTARDGGLTVTGELAIGASHVRLEIPVQVEPAAGGELRVEGETTVDRSAVGVGWNKLGMIAADAVLHARLTLVPTTGR